MLVSREFSAIDFLRLDKIISSWALSLKDLVKKVNLFKPFDVKKVAIRKDRYFPNAYVVDLPLDSMPDHVWQHIFERTWKSSIHLWDRKLYVIGDKLRLLTPPDEFAEKLDWIEQVIEETNKDVDKHNRVVQLEEEGKQKQEIWEEKARVETMKEILRRRFAAV
jgi:hypothetical protein